MLRRLSFAALILVWALAPSQLAASFLRGDADGDGKVDTADALFTLDVLLTGKGAFPCEDAADAKPVRVGGQKTREEAGEGEHRKHGGRVVPGREQKRLEEAVAGFHSRYGDRAQGAHRAEGEEASPQRRDELRPFRKWPGPRKPHTDWPRPSGRWRCWTAEWCRR